MSDERNPTDHEAGDAPAEQSLPRESPPVERRRRRRGGRPAMADPEPAVEPPPPAEEDDFAADEYADGSAFYRFSAFLGLAAAAVFAAATVTYNTVGTFSKEVLALLIVALVLGTLYVIPRLDELTAWLRTRSARQGGNVTLASVAVLGLLVVGNWYTNRHSPQWDLTAAKRFTLSDQTKKILGNLKQDVKVVAFLPSRQEDTFTRGTKDLLQLYARQSPRISVEFVDPEINPGKADQYQITNYPTTLFLMGDRKEESTGVTEQDFTSALVKLTRNEQKKVYFLQGHQERDPDSSQQSGLNSAFSGLKRENYAVEKLSLAQTQKVPDDAAVLVIAGPRVPLLDLERQAVADYLDRGGHVFLMVEPRQDAGLGDLLDRWNVRLDDDVVIDPGSYYGNDPLTVVPAPQAGHRISAGLPIALFPNARSVTIKSGAGSDFAIAPLLKTTDRSWGETKLPITQDTRLDPGEDIQGPVNLAVAVSKAEPTPAFSPSATPTPTTDEKKPKGRLVVAGNVEFASNALFGGVQGNRNFFVNSVNWLAEDEDLISIKAEAAPPPIVLTNRSQVLVFYTSVVFVPMAVLILGAAIWWQRR